MSLLILKSKWEWSTLVFSVVNGAVVEVLMSTTIVSSIVVEVKAAEIIPNTDSYASEYTLRFPRFLHIREDKDWTSCMAMSEVHRMFREFKGKLSTRQVDLKSTGYEL